jgi:CPA2 family monovalent cation:H+ antiporter-2
VLPEALVLAAVTGATKLIAGRLIARRSGLEARAGSRVGALLLARGEFSIVIALVATNSGLEFVGPLAAAYVLILAVIGPLLTRVLAAPPPTSTAPSAPDR